MNVLIDGLTPKVSSLKEVLRALPRTTAAGARTPLRHRTGKIDHRLEVLEGFITAFLTLDEVSNIIRYDDTRRPLSCARTGAAPSFRATSRADISLSGPRRRRAYRGPEPTRSSHIRLRSLRRLEEMELRAEFDRLTDGTRSARGPSREPRKAVDRVAQQIRETKKTFVKGRSGRDAATTFAGPPRPPRAIRGE